MLAASAALLLVFGGEALARCDDQRRAVATALVDEARALEDELERSVRLKRSLAVCPGYRAWLELGRAEMDLGNWPDATYAFENARDFHAPDRDGALGASEIERQALGNAWLAESYRRGGELARAVVAAEEAREGFELVGRRAPARLLREQAAIDDELAGADSAVLARSLDIQHERATRGIGVRPSIRETPDSEALREETAAIVADYEGDAAPAETAVADASRPPVPESPPTPSADTSTPVSAPAGGTDVTESRLNIPVLFGFDSASLAPESERTVAQLAAAIDRLDLDAAATVLVIGHTDAQGAAAYNLALSERRAEAVRRRIRELSATPARLESVGRGEAELRYAGTGADDHRRNRRVELVVRR